MPMNILIIGGWICRHNFTETLLDLGHNVHVLTLCGLVIFPEHPGLNVTQGDIQEIESSCRNGCSHTPNVANDLSDLNSKLNQEVNVLATKLLVEKAIEW